MAKANYTTIEVAGREDQLVVLGRIGREQGRSPGPGEAVGLQRSSHLIVGAAELIGHVEAVRLVRLRVGLPTDAEEAEVEQLHRTGEHAIARQPRLIRKSEVYTP